MLLWRRWLLTGTPTSGDPILVTFSHNGAGDVLTGSIYYVFESRAVPGLGRKRIVIG
jgi:hypothetical protein